MELNIRYAEKSDVKSLKKFDPSYKYFSKRIMDQVPIIIAEVEDVGLIAYLVYDCADYCYTLDYVYVSPDYRGQYVGQALVKLVTDKVLGDDDGFKRLYVECMVGCDNLTKTIADLKFIRKMGFSVISKENNIYTTRYDRPEVAVFRIANSNRMLPWFPESFPEIVGDGLD